MCDCIVTCCVWWCVKFGFVGLSRIRVTADLTLSYLLQTSLSTSQFWNMRVTWQGHFERLTNLTAECYNRLDAWRQPTTIVVVESEFWRRPGTLFITLINPAPLSMFDTSANSSSSVTGGSQWVEKPTEGNGLRWSLANIWAVIVVPNTLTLSNSLHKSWCKKKRLTWRTCLPRTCWQTFSRRHWTRWNSDHFEIRCLQSKFGYSWERAYLKLGTILFSSCSEECWNSCNTNTMYIILLRVPHRHCTCYLV